MKSAAQIEAQLDLAAQNTPRFDSAYIEGVENALRWVLDEGLYADEPPMED